MIRYTELKVNDIIKETLHCQCEEDCFILWLVTSLSDHYRDIGVTCITINQNAQCSYLGLYYIYMGWSQNFSNYNLEYHRFKIISSIDKLHGVTNKQLKLKKVDEPRIISRLELITEE